jgi:hypothetical protein
MKQYKVVVIQQDIEKKVNEIAADGWVLDCVDDVKHYFSKQKRKPRKRKVIQ